MQASALRAEVIDEGRIILVYVARRCGSKRAKLPWDVKIFTLLDHLVLLAIYFYMLFVYLRYISTP